MVQHVGDFPLLRFAIVTLAPAICLIVAALSGGIWPWIAVIYLTGFIFVMDRLLPTDTGNIDPGSEFPATDPLLIALATLHVVIAMLCIVAVAPSPALSFGQKALIAIGAGLFFGQISHPAAHELIHRKKRWLHNLGRVIYTSLLVGHHASAHLRVHHVHVGREDDPNSPRPGEGFYRYVLRASQQSFLAGFSAETRLRGGRVTISHPYVLYVGGGLGLAAVSAWVAGAPGLLMLLFLSLYAQLQILMSDYVQHYGLQRQLLPDGAPEPVGPQHSWNAPHWFSASLMLNAPRHSDHHVSPARPYPALQLDPEKMPMLPYPVPLMAGLALFPRLWRKIMDPRCGQWRARPWTTRPDVTAADISPEVLAAAKSGGIPGTPLPQSDHEVDVDTPIRQPANAGGKPKRNERGGV